MELLQALPNGGAVVAMIAIVIIFHKKQEHYEARMDAIAGRLESIALQVLAEASAARRDYLDRIDRLHHAEKRPPEDPR